MRQRSNCWRRLSEKGCQFLDRGCKQLDPHPELRIRSPGSVIVPIHFLHQLLGRGFFDIAQRFAVGSAGLNYVAKARCVRIHQGVAAETSNLDELAHDLILLTKHLYPVLQPVYGWIDELGENAVGRNFTLVGELRYVFWANVFGAFSSSSSARSSLPRVPRIASIGWRTAVRSW